MIQVFDRNRYLKIMELIYIYIYATEYNQKWYDFAWKYKLRNGTKMQSLFFFIWILFLLFQWYLIESSMLVTVIQRKNSLLSLEKFDLDRYICIIYICIMSSTFTHKVARYVSLKLVVVYILVCRLKSG